MSETKKFSIVIPTCNRVELLLLCLDRLLDGAQSLPASKYEVIVTDDGNTFEARDIIAERYSEVRWVPGPRKGPAANRNNGASHACGEWLIFTDDDCIPGPSWLAAYMQGMGAHPNVSIFEGRTHTDRPRKSFAETSPVNETGGYLWSCNIAVRKSLFEEAGRFDERFPYAAMEDADFQYRIRARGVKCIFLRDAAVCHPWRARGGWTAFMRHQKSTLIYLDIHPDERARISSLFYLRATFQTLRKVTLPGLIKYRGAGLMQELQSHLANLKMAWTLFFRARGTASQTAVSVESRDNSV